MNGIRQWECTLCHNPDPTIHGGAALNSEKEPLPQHADCSAKITQFLHSSENAPYFKDWSCAICGQAQPNIKGKTVIHGNKKQHPFHADCLDLNIHQWEPQCPVCKDPIYPEEKTPKSRYEFGDWLLVIQPWILGSIYQNDNKARAVASFANTTWALADFNKTRQKALALRKSVLFIEIFLKNYKPDPHSPTLYARKCIYQWIRPRLSEQIKEQDQLYYLHLVRMVATAAIGIGSLIRLKNRTG